MHIQSFANHVLDAKENYGEKGGKYCFAKNQKQNPWSK